MDDFRFPLADRWAIELAADVLTASEARRLKTHHVSTIGGTLYRACFLFGEKRNRLHHRVRGALRTLEAGFETAPETMGKVLETTLYKLGALQQHDSNLHQDAWEAPKDDPERRYRPLLQVYQWSFERYYRVLAAPFVVADALDRGAKDPLHLLDHDARVQRPVIQEMERKRGFPSGALTEGLNRHLRNSIAHNRYDILSTDRIKMWDERPGGDITWGPHEFGYYEIRDEIQGFAVTCTVLLLALILFDVAYGRLMVDRGWLEPRLMKQRSDVLKSALEDPAQRHGFTVSTVDQDGEELRVHLVVVGRTMPDQVSEILSGGGPGPPEKHIQEIRTVWGPVWKQVYGFLQMSFDLHGAYELVRLSVEGKQDEDYGQLEAPHAAREKMIEGADPGELRQEMLSDTLSDEEIPVVQRSPPRPA